MASSDESTTDEHEAEPSDEELDEIAEAAADRVVRILNGFSASSPSPGDDRNGPADPLDQTSSQLSGPEPDESAPMLREFFDQLMAEFNKLEDRNPRRSDGGTDGVEEPPEPKQGPGTPSDNPREERFREDLERIRRRARSAGFREGYQRGAREALLHLRKQLGDRSVRSALELLFFGSVQLELDLDAESPPE